MTVAISPRTKVIANAVKVNSFEKAIMVSFPNFSPTIASKEIKKYHKKG